MSWLGDLFGGKKAPPPPGQIREAAEKAFDLANDYRMRPGEFRKFVDDWDWNDHLRGGMMRSDAGYAGARGQAADIGGDYESLWGDQGLPILQESAGEILAAGSDGRQGEARRQAIAAAIGGMNMAEAGRVDDLARRGRIAGGGDSPHLAVLKGAQLGRIGNEAAEQERRYGEMARMQYLPTAMRFGSEALRHKMILPELDMLGTQALFQYPQMLAGLYGTEADLTGAAQGLYGTGQAMFGNSYNADMTKLNADNARRQRIFGNATSLLMGKHLGGDSEGKGKQSIADMAIKYLPMVMGAG